MVLCERAYKEVECVVTLVCYNRQKDMCFVRSISLNWRCQFTKHVFSSWSCFELGCIAWALLCSVLDHVLNLVVSIAWALLCSVLDHVLNLVVSIAWALLVLFLYCSRHVSWWLRTTSVADDWWVWTLCSSFQRSNVPPPSRSESKKERCIVM